MTADQLARALGISRPWLFEIKRRFAAQAPQSFDADLEAWKTFVDFTRTQVKVRGRKSAKTALELSDYGRLVRLRGDKLEIEKEMAAISLAATKRLMVRQEEIHLVFNKLGSILRGRLLKVRNDLPCSLLGLSESAMDAILREKFDEVMSDFSLPPDFFNSRSAV